MAQELKAYNVVATADVNPEVVDSLGCTEWAGYNKDEVDAVLAEREAELAALKDERRWRKFPDEKPEHNGIFIVLLGEHTRTLDAYDTDKGKFKTYRPTAWMPLPKAPEE